MIICYKNQPNPLDRRSVYENILYVIDDFYCVIDDCIVSSQLKMYYVTD